MKSIHIALAAAATACAMTFSSCEEDVTSVGSSLSKNEVVIVVDTLKTDLSARSTDYQFLDTRSTAKLLGRIAVPEFGSVESSFVSRLLPATQMNIPDSITADHIDSLRLIFRAARGGFTGDSLAPQQLKVFALQKQLPNDINNAFDPTGYFDPSSPLGVKSYTLSAIALSDSALRKGKSIDVPVKLPGQLAAKVFEAYRKDPSIFAWPQEFAKYFPGIYVEQSFGSGCLANFSNFQAFLYYHYTVERTVLEDSVSTKKAVLMKDSVSLFAAAPEVLSANCIKYAMAPALRAQIGSGKIVITTPGGVYADIVFPADRIIKAYRESTKRLAVISNLTFKIPAKTITNQYGLTPPPYLLMVRSSHRDDFFANNEVPDKKNTFWATYDATTASYDFSSMRDYILELLESDKAVDMTDMNFSLVPVNIQTETDTNPYTGATITYVVGCTPYIQTPTMAVLDTENAEIIFTYSSEVIK